jgi:ubiquinone/menaquinone biosynthesis C-methylase UbiE
MKENISEHEILNQVREHYGGLASNFSPTTQASCCSSTPDLDCCSPAEEDSFVKLYEDPEIANLPEEVTGLSLGCGDPVTLAALEPGQTVLDLGSGGGIDCFLASRQVGPTGKVIGVDMTPAMLEKARANKEKMGLENVEFRLGEIEHIPVPDSTVDVIISNCVINLSPDKPQVFREAYRVLKPGGKLSVSDIVTDGPLPETIKNSLSAWAGCIAGALEVSEYINAIEAAGFTNVELLPVYWSREMVDQAIDELGEEVDISALPDNTIEKTVFSAKITAYKPG